MSRTESHTILSRLAIALLVTGGLLTLSALPRPVTAQEKKAEAKKTEAKPQEKKAEAKPQEKKAEAKPAEKKAEAKPQEKKAEAKPQEKKAEAKPQEKKAEAKPRRRSPSHRPARPRRRPRQAQGPGHRAAAGSGPAQAQGRDPGAREARRLGLRRQGEGRQGDRHGQHPQEVGRRQGCHATAQERAQPPGRLHRQRPGQRRGHSPRSRTCPP